MILVDDLIKSKKFSGIHDGDDKIVHYFNVLVMLAGVLTNDEKNI